MVLDVSRTATFVRVCSRHNISIIYAYLFLFYTNKLYSRGWKNKVTLLGFGCEHKFSPLIHDQRELTRWSFESVVSVSCIYVVSFQTDLETIKKKIVCNIQNRPDVKVVHTQLGKIIKMLLLFICCKRAYKTKSIAPRLNFASYQFIFTVLRYVTRSFICLYHKQNEKNDTYMFQTIEKSQYRANTFLNKYNIYGTPVL